jgi:hypothetical protein
MKGGGAGGPGSGGFCGLPTSEVDHVATQRPLPLCAIAGGASRPATLAGTAAAAMARVTRESTVRQRMLHLSIGDFISSGLRFESSWSLARYSSPVA